VNGKACRCSNSVVLDFFSSGHSSVKLSDDESSDESMSAGSPTSSPPPEDAKCTKLLQLQQPLKRRTLVHVCKEGLRRTWSLGRELSKDYTSIIFE
jgi:hypothetical protein